MESLRCGNAGTSGQNEMYAFLKAMNGGKDVAPEMLQQAEQTWRMLDDMAESSPEEYARFLSQQQQAAKSAKSAKQAQSVAAPHRPLMILNAAVLHPIKAVGTRGSDKSGSCVDIHSIVKPSEASVKDNKIREAVISLGESTQAGCVQLGSKAWVTSDGAAVLKQASVPFKVLPCDSSCRHHCLLQLLQSSCLATAFAIISGQGCRIAACVSRVEE